LVTLLAYIVGVIVVFVVGNGLLWGIQELLSRRHVNTMNELRPEITVLEQRIEHSRNWLETNRNRYERYGPVGEYNDSVDREHAQIDSFNSLAERYNKAARKAGSRWYLIPIPGRGSR
jgi:hypothetical protein